MSHIVSTDNHNTYEEKFLGILNNILKYWRGSKTKNVWELLRQTNPFSLPDFS